MEGARTDKGLAHAGAEAGQGAAGVAAAQQHASARRTHYAVHLRMPQADMQLRWCGGQHQEHLLVHRLRNIALPAMRVQLSTPKRCIVVAGASPEAGMAPLTKIVWGTETGNKGATLGLPLGGWARA